MKGCNKIGLNLDPDFGSKSMILQKELVLIGARAGGMLESKYSCKNKIASRPPSTITRSWGGNKYTYRSILGPNETQYSVNMKIN